MHASIKSRICVYIYICQQEQNVVREKEGEDSILVMTFCLAHERQLKNVVLLCTVVVIFSGRVYQSRGETLFSPSVSYLVFATQL